MNNYLEAKPFVMSFVKIYWLSQLKLFKNEAINESNLSEKIVRWNKKICWMFGNTLNG